MFRKISRLISGRPSVGEAARYDLREVREDSCRLTGCLFQAAGKKIVRKVRKHKAEPGLSSQPYYGNHSRM